MTKREIVEKMMEFDKNYYTKYDLKVEETYKYRGEIKTRYTFKLTEEGKMLFALGDKKEFVCPCCGEKVGFNDLESWLGESVEDFLEDKVICSDCYADEMGEDL